MSKNNVLITTTNVVQGIDIKQYKGIVSARVVTGTDYFSDLFAGFSDVFGGRSSTYQRQLKSIYDEVIEILSDEAKKVGANAILGVSIDNDEITGKGKQMFMITATGTAVVSSTEINGVEHPTDEISFERFDFEYNKLKKIFSIKNDIYQIEPNWSFLIQSGVYEVMEEVYRFYVSDTYSYLNGNENTYKYFNAVEETKAKAFLYGKLDDIEEQIKLVSLIKATKLVDYDYINSKCLTENETMKKYLFALITGNKKNYYKEDIQKLSDLMKFFIEAFPINAISIDREKWTCRCGKVNKINQRYCKSCTKDARGLKLEEIDYDQSIALLKEKLFVLEHIFINKVN
ncbi:YbjQ family protein [Paenibacillus paridis]|uniref:YbjQ family protein n=1 Tax=Paenibacillus paridis TaxID=2583376 RepID=UPI001122BB9C|nr:YbjQ family protein [Paenibacillus paridis]